MDYEDYFDRLYTDSKKIYNIASEARSKGLDPEVTVEIPIVGNLAERVEKLLIDYNVEGVSKIIEETLKTMDREAAAIHVAKKIVKDGKDSREKLIEKALRVSLAILTEGVLIAPIDGLSHVEIVKEGNTDYLAIYYSGPIRASGGTGQALTILIADILRRDLGIGKYVATRDEIERFKEEIPLYKQVQHLQYLPSPEEIEEIIKNIPVSIYGDRTEDVDVTGYINLPRVKTDGVRGGACLVIAEGLSLKATKIMKYVNALNLDGWNFLNVIIKRSSENSGKSSEQKYLKDGVVAGRPILSHPSRPGGFRLRYGRSRNTGLAAVGINPATLYVLDQFVVAGTQLKLECPGKAGAVSPCDTIDGPIIELMDGSVTHINTIEEYTIVKNKIKKILDLGEILISYGEFLENNHPLLPGSYSIEWHILELFKKNADKEDIDLSIYNPSFNESYKISKKYNIPMHPSFNLFWHDLSVEEIIAISLWIEKNYDCYDNALKIKKNDDIIKILHKLGIQFSLEDNFIKLDIERAKSLVIPLGLRFENDEISRDKKIPEQLKDPMELVSELAGIKIVRKAPTRIGARMGRPEKADIRHMEKVNTLFPADKYVKEDLIKNGYIKIISVEMNKRRCPACKTETYKHLCPDCLMHTDMMNSTQVYNIDIGELLTSAKQMLNTSSTINKIKFVEGLISGYKVPEDIRKGVLRAQHGIYVFKDGTVRYDMVDLPLTHFKPAEVGTEISKLHELGYDADIFGQPLTSDEQIVELKVHDVILPIKAGDHLVKVSKFIDDELEKIYKISPFYNAYNRSDLIGAYIAALAPHTSGAVIGRIAGYSSIDGCYAHPYFHASKRRNCDGDEDGIMLLMDAFLNFSKQYLPKTNGGLMDAPLLLTYRIDPSEIDKEVQNLDVMPLYPLEMYNAAEHGKMPKEVDKYIDNVSKRIHGEHMYDRLSFTHDVTDISTGPHESIYKSDSKMDDKIRAVNRLMEKIRAVDIDDAVALMIEHHLMKDINGNMSGFYKQQFRCKKCKTTYRRIPLTGRCRTIDAGSLCNGEIIRNINIGNITKYIHIVRELSEKYNIPEYIKNKIKKLDNDIKVISSDSVSSLDSFGENP